MIVHKSTNHKKYVIGKGLCACNDRRYMYGKGFALSAPGSLGSGLADIIQAVMKIGQAAGSTAAIGKNVHSIVKDSKEMANAKKAAKEIKKLQMANLIEEISGSGFATL